MRKLAFVVFLMCMVALPSAHASALAFRHTTTNAEILVQTVPGPTISEKVSSRAKSSWSWYITRASGLFAALSLIILMVSGIGQVTGYTYRFLEPLTDWASHRALGITFGISILLHVFSLLFDHFVPFNIAQLFIPWLSGYKPVTIWGVHLGSLYVALGVIAFYLIAGVIITSLTWVDKKPATWKLIHLLSYFALLLVFIHALYLGTDLAHGVFRFVWVCLGLVTILFCLHRLWRAKTV